MTHQQLLPGILALAFLYLPGRAAICEAPGVPNFHQVNDHIYRGGQPSGGGWESLANLGVKVVLDLRYDNELQEHWVKSEEQAVEAAGMRYVNLPWNGLATPTDAQISQILAVLDSGEPVFVHCRAGKDRTGTAIACYRIAHDRWQNEQALEEAKSIGLNPLALGMEGYITKFHSS